MAIIMETSATRVARIKAKRDMLKAEGFETVWFYTNVQSGDSSHSLVEPERGDHEMFHIQEIPLDKVPDWAIDIIC